MRAKQDTPTSADQRFVEAARRVAALYRQVPESARGLKLWGDQWAAALHELVEAERRLEAR